MKLTSWWKESAVVPLLLSALLGAGAVGISLVVAEEKRPAEPRDAGAAGPAGPAETSPDPIAPENENGAVQAVMRGVDFHFDPTVVLRIVYLRGTLLPARPGQPPFFDDESSFTLVIDTAEVVLGTAALNDLLNNHVFNFPDSPLRRLQVTIEGNQLKQKGQVHGTPFTVVSDVAVTPAGEVRLRPTTIRAFGIPVGGLMRRFGITMQRVAHIERAQGARLEGNDLILSPDAMLPAPRIRGHLVKLTLGDNELVQVFGNGQAGRRAGGQAEGRSDTRAVQSVVEGPIQIPDTSARNYMYYRGATLRFGRLTMTPADLLIVDYDPTDPFDFFLDRYEDQLVAGYSRNTATGGLITVMPDFNESATWRRKGGVKAQ